MSVEEAVANGVQWMNENLGEDWPEFIDRETFDVGDIWNCVLGQTFDTGSSWPGFTAAAPLFTDARTFGFDTMDNYSDLQAEWEMYLDGYELLADA